MNFKIIILISFAVSLNSNYMSADNAKYDANNIMQLEKPVIKKVTDSTKYIAASGVGIKQNIDEFFTAFGKLFETQRKRKTDNRISPNKKKKGSSDTQPSSVKSNKEVFGFYPYWFDDSLETYDYKLLSSIAYFGYDLDPYTGKYRYLKNWKTTKLIDKAKANNTKVYLTVTNLSEKNNRQFLDTIKSAKAAQEKSINTILQLLNFREAHGVTVYFENVPCDYKDNYTNYIRNLSVRLRDFNKKVVVILPALDLNGCFDVLALDAYVEYFVVLGDNYYGSWSDVAGPVAPLHGGNLWTQGNLENTIEEYLIAGIPKEKLIISLPFYGNKWETEDAEVPTYTKSFLGKLTYKDIMENYTQKVYFDPESQTNYMNFKEGKKFVQIWFDDARSMGKKFDIIKTEQLAGVGLWAMGKDEGRAELWEVLDSKFKQNKGFIPKPAEKPLTLILIFKKKGVLKGLIWVTTIIFILGFLLSLRNIEVRSIVFKESLIKNIILFGIPLLLFTVMYLLLENKLWSIMVFMGILLGYGLYYLLVKTEQNINDANRIP